MSTERIIGPDSLGAARIQLCVTPRMFLVDEFATTDETEHVLAIASEESLLRKHAASYERDSASFTAELLVATDPVLVGWRARLQELVGLRNDRADVMRLRAYVPGESHPPHTDAFDDHGTTLILTAMLYLTTSSGGGGTRFGVAEPKALTVLPRAGRLLLWFSYLSNGTPDPKAVHEALAVTSGHKVVVNTFFYQPLSVCEKIPILLSATGASGG